MELDIPFITNNDKNQGEEDFQEKLQNLSINDLVRPNEIDNRPDHIKINNELYRAILVEGFPSTIQSTFISEMLENEIPMDMSIRIDPYGQKRAQKTIEDELTKLESDSSRQERQGRITRSLQNRIEDVANLLRALNHGQERLFDVSFNIATAGRDKEELQKNTDKVISEMNAQKLISGIPKFKMEQAYKTTLPTTKNSIKKHTDAQPRVMPTGAVAEMFPFAGTAMELENRGIFIGENLRTRQPVSVDVYELTNPNWIDIGTSGSGKSYAAKLMIDRYAMQGVDMFIIDPHGEYGPLVDQLAGQNLELSVKSGNMINPMDMMGLTYREKVKSLKELLQIMCTDLTKAQIPKAMHAVNQTYKDHGIIQGQPETWDNKPPTIEDLYEKLKQLKAEAEKSDKKSYDVIIEQLRTYVDGVNDYLNTQTSIDPNKQVVNFDISELPNDDYPVVMFMVLSYLYSHMKDNKKRKMIVVDEAWELLSGATQTGGDLKNSFIFKVVKSSRKFNLSLGLLVQEINDLLNSEEGGAVINNTSMKLMLRQEKQAAENLASTLGLNQQEKNFLRQANRGEAILLADNRHIPLKVKASPEAHEVITTEPDEVIEHKSQYEEERRPDRSTPDDLGDAEEPEQLEPEDHNSEAITEGDVRFKEPIKEADFPERDFYKQIELTDDQIERLKQSSDWERDNTPPFRGGKGRTAWVRAPGPVSSEHERLTHEYALEVSEYTKKINLSKKRADVEFTDDDDRKIGIEIETGTNIDHNREELERKSERNNEEYDDWFFVVTRKDMKDRYHEYGDVLIRTKVEDRIKSYFETEGHGEESEEKV